MNCTINTGLPGGKCQEKARWVAFYDKKICCALCPRHFTSLKEKRPEDASVYCWLACLEFNGDSPRACYSDPVMYKDNSPDFRCRDHWERYKKESPTLVKYWKEIPVDL